MRPFFLPLCTNVVEDEFRGVGPGSHPPRNRTVIQSKPVRNSAIPPKGIYAKHDIWRGRIRLHAIYCGAKTSLAYWLDTRFLPLCDPSIPSPRA